MHCRGNMCWCHYRSSRCSRYCRRSWGCGSADSGSAAEVVAAEGSEYEEYADDADGAGDADGGSALEEAEKGIDRTSHGNSSALGHRYCTGWGTLRNRCTAHMCHHYRASRCSRYCRTSWGCGSADSGCAACADGGCAVGGRAVRADDADGVDGGCVMTTEFRNPSSRCRGCRKYTGHLDRRRRILHHRRSCRCLSIVPPWESVDGGRALESGCATLRRSRICTKRRCWHSRSDTPTGTNRMRSCLSLGMSL